LFHPLRGLGLIPVVFVFTPSLLKGEEEEWIGRWKIAPGVATCHARRNTGRVLKKVIPMRFNCHFLLLGLSFTNV
jgi:hypothetical protein